ncbi:hypothetical protein GGX14DRAFT_400627 [Mycena pura]|uniref:Uncharacterized protein n=1 Tax=Mycena pura TaxID=153505 RepID=A0AAD6V5S7_9AGAR|nr:hypothetical protein GGX14DRAFT_400627 [Mycena pura]
MTAKHVLVMCSTAGVGSTAPGATVTAPDPPHTGGAAGGGRRDGDGTGGPCGWRQAAGRDGRSARLGMQRGGATIGGAWAGRRAAGGGRRAAGWRWDGRERAAGGARLVLPSRINKAKLHRLDSATTRCRSVQVWSQRLLESLRHRVGADPV